MNIVVRTTLFGLAAFLGWLGLSYLVLIFSGTTQAPLSENVIHWFPLFAALPALLLSGGVASYFAEERWLLSSALAGTVGVGLLWLSTSFSGVWWAVAATGGFGILLAVVSGFVVQLVLHRK